MLAVSSVQLFLAGAARAGRELSVCKAFALRAPHGRAWEGWRAHWVDRASEYALEQHAASVAARSAARRAILAMRSGEDRLWATTERFSPSTPIAHHRHAVECRRRSEALSAHAVRFACLRRVRAWRQLAHAKARRSQWRRAAER